MHSSKEEKLLPIHVISVLDSLIRVDKTLQAEDEKVGGQNWAVVESIMGRSLTFFESIDEVSTVALLLRRLHNCRDKMDVEELFEKAEMRLL